MKPPKYEKTRGTRGAIRATPLTKESPHHTPQERHRVARATARPGAVDEGCSWEVMYAALQLDQGKELGGHMPYTLPLQ